MFAVMKEIIRLERKPLSRDVREKLVLSMNSVCFIHFKMIYAYYLNIAWQKN